MSECKHDFEKVFLSTKNADVSLRRLQAVSIDGKTTDLGYGIMVNHKDKLTCWSFQFCPMCGAALNPKPIEAAHPAPAEGERSDE